MIGERFSEKRDELGQDIEGIAHILKIKSEYLRAIEDEAFEKLPIEVYAKGYIREYARFLNIDPEDAIKAYTQKTSPPPIETFPPVHVAKKKKTYILYLSILLIVLSAVVVSILSFPSSKKQEVIKRDMVPSVHSSYVPHVLEISATGTTWLLVRIDDKESKEMLLKIGESAKWTAKNNFSLKIGNAGGIKVVFDGKEISPLGAEGQVVRLKLPGPESR